MDVQFNPSEYTITRGVTIDNKTGAGQQNSTKEKQVVDSKPSTLNLTLYFDSYSDLEGMDFGGIAKKAVGAISGMVGGGPGANEAMEEPEVNEKVTDLSEKIATLSRFASNLHEPPDIRFVWGAGLKFQGKVISSSVQYTMFAPDGTPVRIKVAMTIEGEELEIIEQEEGMPFESPDRTKERVLPYGDQLWMVAEEEYGDPSQWKTIAKANNILNPRSIDRAVRLKVPSIQ